MSEVEDEVMEAEVQSYPCNAHLTRLQNEVEAVLGKVSEGLLLSVPALERNDDFGRVLVLYDAVVICPVDYIISAILELSFSDALYVGGYVDGGIRCLCCHRRLRPSSVLPDELRLSG